MAEELDIKAVLFGTARRMHHVQRYSSVPVVSPENVAEHSWQVAFISMAIGIDLSGQFMVDMGKLLRRAVVHDVSETLSGDIIRSYKHSFPEITRAMQDADQLNMERLGDEVGGASGHAVVVSWGNQKRDDPEGQIIRLADLLCVVSYCVAEDRLGNREMRPILRAMYEENLAVYHENSMFSKYVDPIFPSRKWDDPLQLPVSSPGGDFDER